MAQVRLAAKNSLFLIFESGVTRIVEFFIFIWLNHYLSKNLFGQYNFIFVYLNFFAIFIDLGMDGILQREIARKSSLSSKLMGVGLTFGIVMSLFLILFSFIISSFSYDAETAKLILIASPFIVFSAKIKSFRKMFEVMFVVKFRIIYLVVFNIFGRVIFLVSLWWIISNDGPFLYIIIAAALCDLPGFLLMLLHFFKFFPFPKFGFDKAELIGLLKKSYPLLLSAVFQIINLRVAVLIIESFMDLGEVALFVAASRIPEFLSFIPVAFNIPLSPILARKYILSKDAFFNVFGIVTKFLIIIAIPITLYFFFYMKDIILFLFRPEYIDSVLPAQIMIFSQLFIFISVILYSSLVASDKQKYQFFFIVSSGGLNLILNILLVPLFGIIGASISVIISYGIFLPIGIIHRNTREYVIIIIEKLIKPLIASIGIIMAFLIFRENYFWVIPLGLLFYIVIFYFIKGLNEKDKEVIIELFKG